MQRCEAPAAECADFLQLEAACHALLCICEWSIVIKSRQSCCLCKQKAMHVCISQTLCSLVLQAVYTLACFVQGHQYCSVCEIRKGAATSLITVDFAFISHSPRLMQQSQGAIRASLLLRQGQAQRAQFSLSQQVHPENSTVLFCHVGIAITSD